MISYIKSQITSGVSRDSISSILSGQGWQAQDIQEGFNAASGIVPSMNSQSTVTQPVATIKSGSIIGRIFFWFSAIGIVGVLGFGAYFTYGLFFNQSVLVTPLCSIIMAGKWDKNSAPYSVRVEQCKCEASYFISSVGQNKPLKETMQGLFNMVFNKKSKLDTNCNPNNTDISKAASKLLNTDKIINEVVNTKKL